MFGTCTFLRYPISRSSSSSSSIVAHLSRTLTHILVSRLNLSSRSHGPLICLLVIKSISRSKISQQQRHTGVRAFRMVHEYQATLQYVEDLRASAQHLSAAKLIASTSWCVTAFAPPVQVSRRVVYQQHDSIRQWQDLGSNSNLNHSQTSDGPLGSQWGSSNAPATFILFTYLREWKIIYEYCCCQLWVVKLFGKLTLSIKPPLFHMWYSRQKYDLVGE